MHNIKIIHMLVVLITKTNRLFQNCSEFYKNAIEYITVIK